MRTFCLILLIALALPGCSRIDDSNSPGLSQVPNPAGSHARYPFLAQGAEGVLMSWLQVESEEAGLMWSAFNGDSWSAPELIQESNRFFVNWADFPSIAAIGEVPVAAHWLQKVEGSTYAYHVNMAFRSAAGGWTEPITPHADVSPSEHGFASMIPVDEDRVFAVWLDGYQAEAGKPMTLHSALVHRSGTVEQETEVDGSVCDCCQTSIARSGQGIVAVYRDRTGDEIRDIYSAVYDLDSGSWGNPQPVSDDRWEIAGCPVNGPQIAAHEDTVIVTWFTAAADLPRTFMAVSRDAGMSFAKAVQLDSGETAGRVGIAFNGDGTALLTWVEAGAESNSVIGRFWRDSTLESPFRIGDIQSSRASGFPRVAASGSGFLVAWTKGDNEATLGVETVLVTPVFP